MRTTTLLSAAILALTLVLTRPGGAAAGAQSLAPAAPSDLTAVGVSTSAITISWTDNSSDELGFEIEHCQGAGCTDFVHLATMSANATNATISSLGKNKTYTYRVRASNAAGDSAYSNVAWATTLR
ncbi:MAG TPA: fibronectin type III domain-containing protein [Pyrinomonadaceae bacterium]|jgi:hypothetical protein